jgi:hypothetical protein
MTCPFCRTPDMAEWDAILRVGVCRVCARRWWYARIAGSHSDLTFMIARGRFWPSTAACLRFPVREPCEYGHPCESPLFPKTPTG